jgi:FkbM family methyltransferase
VEFVAEDSQDIEYDEFSSEESIIEEIVSDVNSNDVFYDIGSNIGLYSCVVSQKIDAKAVVAFEPSPPAYRKLRKNSELNGGFHHYQIAISDTDETVEFAVDVGDVQARMSTMNTHSATTDYRIQEVPSRTLSSMVEAEGVPSPTIVKIDVEGAEFKVLSGMEPLLDTVRILYCEIHHPVLDDFDTSRNEIIEYLEAFDFDVTTLHRRGQNEFVKATRMQG